MGKHVSRGYTLLSTVIALTVMAIISLWSFTSFSTSYEIYALNHCVELSKIALNRAKFTSFLLAKQVNVCFNKDSIVVGEYEYKLPRGIHGERDVCFWFNARGNTSMANTITFYGDTYKISFAIQIGGGYYEIREVEGSL